MKKNPTDQELLEKAASFCAYQERSERDVLQRLHKWEVPPDKAKSLVEQLKEENFLNNERFALAYARGRFRIKKWGRMKIRHGLYQHGIEHDLVEAAVYSINDDDYLDTFQALFSEKVKGMRKPGLKDKARVYNYLTGRGFEYDMIREQWDVQFKDC